MNVHPSATLCSALFSHHWKVKAILCKIIPEHDSGYYKHCNLKLCCIKLIHSPPASQNHVFILTIAINISQFSFPTYQIQQPGLLPYIWVWCCSYLSTVIYGCASLVQWCTKVCVFFLFVFFYFIFLQLVSKNVHKNIETKHRGVNTTLSHTSAILSILLYIAPFWVENCRSIVPLIEFPLQCPASGSVQVVHFSTNFL